jgi:ferredoxin-NADP reductase
VPSFEPGQYFSLGLTLEDGPLLRPYSTASPRGACGSLEFLIRRVSTGTFTPRLWDLAVGEKLWIGPPKGLFTLKPGDPRTHLLVSAGTGIAPFISMLPELIGGVATEPVAAERVAAERLAPEPPSGARPRVVVAHGVSYEPELAYRAWLESLARERHGLVYAPAVSRPNAPQNAGWTGRLGRVETVLPELWTELALEPQDSVAYLCGNPDMVARSREILLGLGMPADAVIHENYWAAPTSLASTGAAA